MPRVLCAVIGAAAVASTAVLGVGSAAAATESSPEISWVARNVVVSGTDPDQATVMAKYRCSGQGFHLWASVKQGPQITETQNTSNFARSWYETPEGPTPVCDGKNHVIRYTVTRAEGWEQLRNGRAWVQFVFFYDNGTEMGGRAADVDWATVRGARR